MKWQAILLVLWASAGVAQQELAGLARRLKIGHCVCSGFWLPNQLQRRQLCRVHQP